MLFPDIRLEDWLKRFPDLLVRKIECASCGIIKETIIPFIMQDYAGVMAPKCTSCDPRSLTYNVIPISKKEIREWESLISR